MALLQQLKISLGTLFAEENYGDFDTAWTILEELRLTTGDYFLEGGKSGSLRSVHLVLRAYWQAY